MSYMLNGTARRIRVIREEMDTITWAREWAANEDAEFLDESAANNLREIIAEGMAFRVRTGQPPVHVRDLYEDGQAGFRIYGFGGPVRRGFVVMSESGVLIGATVAGNGTPAAVWQADDTDRELIVAVLYAHSNDIHGTYFVFSN